MAMRKIKFKVVLIAILAVVTMLPACAPDHPAPYPPPGQISGDQVTNRMFPDRTNLTYPKDTNRLLTDDRPAAKKEE
jgi:hypothetical protein